MRQKKVGPGSYVVGIHHRQPGASASEVATAAGSCALTAAMPARASAAAASAAVVRASKDAARDSAAIARASSPDGSGSPVDDVGFRLRLREEGSMFHTMYEGGQTEVRLRWQAVASAIFLSSPSLAALTLLTTTMSATGRSGATFLLANLGLAGFGAGQSPLFQATKEMVDNAIDAGAARIRVSVLCSRQAVPSEDEDDGEEKGAATVVARRSFTLTVEDDGCGMRIADVPDTVCRVFTTSKAAGAGGGEATDGGDEDGTVGSGGGDSLGRHGIGLKAALLYAQSTGSRPVTPLCVTTTRAGDAEEHCVHLGIDAVSGVPLLVSSASRSRTKTDASFSGTRMEITLDDCLDAAYPALASFFERMRVLPVGRSLIQFELSIADEKDGVDGEEVHDAWLGLPFPVADEFTPPCGVATANASAPVKARNGKSGSGSSTACSAPPSTLPPLTLRATHLDAVLRHFQKQQLSSSASASGAPDAVAAGEDGVYAVDDDADDWGEPCAPSAPPQLLYSDALALNLRAYYGVGAECVAVGSATSIESRGGGDDDEDDDDEDSPPFQATAYVVFTPVPSPAAPPGGGGRGAHARSVTSAAASAASATEEEAAGTYASPSQQLCSDWDTGLDFGAAEQEEAKEEGDDPFGRFDEGGDADFTTTTSVRAALGLEDAAEWDDEFDDGDGEGNALPSPPPSSGSAAAAATPPAPSPAAHALAAAYRRTAAQAGRPFSCAHVLRFVEGVPLTRNAAGCAIQAAVALDVPWKAFGLAAAPFDSATIVRTARGALSKRGLDVLKRSRATPGLAGVDTVAVDRDGVLAVCAANASEPAVVFDTLHVIVDVRRLVGEGAAAAGGGASGGDGDGSSGQHALVFGDLSKSFLHNNMQYRKVVADATTAALRVLSAQLPGLLVSPAELQRRSLFENYLPGIARFVADIVQTAGSHRRPFALDAAAAANTAPTGGGSGGASTDALYSSLLSKLTEHTLANLTIQEEAQRGPAAAAAVAPAALAHTGADAGEGGGDWDALFQQDSQTGGDFSVRVDSAGGKAPDAEEEEEEDPFARAEREAAVMREVDAMERAKERARAARKEASSSVGGTGGRGGAGGNRSRR